MRGLALLAIGVVIALQMVFVVFMHRDPPPEMAPVIPESLLDNGVPLAAVVGKHPPASERVELADAGGGVIRGYVRTSGGEAAAKARITAAFSTLPGGTAIRERREIHSASAGEDGFFQLQSLPSGEYLVAAARGTEAVFMLADVRSEGPAAELWMGLVPAVRAAGRVTDEAGNSLAGATVFPVFLDGERDVARVQRHNIAIAGDDGAFRLGGLPRGACRFAVLPKVGGGFLSHEYILPESSIEIVRPSGYAVAGTVELADTQRGAARVALALEMLPAEIEVARATTDSAGRFRFPSVVPGEYQLRVLSDHLVPKQAYTCRVEENGAHSALTVDVTEIQPLRGRVTAGVSSSEGVPGVMVRAVPVGADMDEGVTFTDARGGFRFDLLRPGKYAIRPMPLGNLYPEPAEQDVEILADRVSKIGDFSMIPGAETRGNVVDKDGLVVPFANVFTETSGEARRGVLADSAGRFRVLALRPGQDYSFHAEYMGLSSALHGPVVAELDQPREVSLVVSLPSQGSIRGQVLNLQGRGRAGVAVQCSSEESVLPEPLLATTDAAGFFQFDGLLPASYRLVPGHSVSELAPPAAKTVTLGPDERLEGVQLVLQ